MTSSNFDESKYIYSMIANKYNFKFNFNYKNNIKFQEVAEV